MPIKQHTLAMDSRTFIAALALLAGASVTLAQTDELQKSQASSSWTYDSKTAQLSGDATGAQRQAAQAILDLELAECSAWNKHDIRSCLAVYWESPNLISISNNDETHGFANLQRELLSAFADPNTMGSMFLDTVKIQVIGNDCANTIASYVVKTQNYVYYCDDTATLRRFPEGWKIVFERTTLVTH
jgi:hypothetical protein